MSAILGISAFYHDSAAALVVDGNIIAAAQEERFTRAKHTASFPTNAIRFCLEHSGCSIDELDAIAFYDKPFLKFERLLETYYAFAPKGLRQFLTAIPTWLKEMHFPHSVGLLYSAFTYYLGFRVNSGEYKLMGLAPYGNPGATQSKEFIALIKEQLVSVKDDGSIWVNQDYFDYATGLKMVKERKWQKLFGFAATPPDGAIDQKHCNLAYAIQSVTEEIVIKMAREAKKITGADCLCMAGGVALNCVANGKLQRENIFSEIYIQPAAGDADGALGAAQIATYLYFNAERTVASGQDSMQGSYLGPDFSDKEAVQAFRKYKATYHLFDSFDELLCSAVADLLDDGQVVGWFQGRMEYGPRALGNRSILADARNTEMQKKLNLKIKYREGFRPFAPAVLAECAQDYFDLPGASPYMLLTAGIKKERRTSLPENYHELDLWQRLYLHRSDIQAVTHLDFSARVQTVHRETNPRFWRLINTFKKKSGYGVVVNTSFDVRGEPIVCDPKDAYRCFMRTEMDYLVINNFMLCKSEQPDWRNREKWMGKFQLD